MCFICYLEKSSDSFKSSLETSLSDALKEFRHIFFWRGDDLIFNGFIWTLHVPFYSFILIFIAPVDLRDNEKA